MDRTALVDEPLDKGPSLDLPTMQARLVGGRFRLGPQIGGSRTGEVFSAEDITTSAPCAVKLIAPAVFPTPLVAQRTERELKQLTKITSDRVARVLDVGKQGDRLYVALELVSGVTLADVLAQQGALPVDQAVRLALEVGEGLAEAAKLGVIHRDVSPKNVMLVADERVATGRRVKLINFGIPTPVSDNKIHGIPEFLSPEQAEGKPVDQRSNIYSLGTLLYTLITGSPPFTGDAQKVILQHGSQAPVPPSQRAMGVPPEVERLLLKALEKSSSRRHLTLRQLLGEMEAALAHLPASGPLDLGAAATKAPASAAHHAPAQVRSSAQHAAQPRPSGGHDAQPHPSRRSHSAAKTMVGIGLKDILPHVANQPDAAHAPAAAHAPVAQAPAPAPHAEPQMYAHAQTEPQRPVPVQAKQAALIVPDPEPPQLPHAAAARPVAPVVHAPSAQPASPVLYQHPYQSTPEPEAPAVTFNAPSRAKPVERSERSERADRSPDSAPAGKSGTRKGKFRETMWFKKGELDEQVAQDAQGKSDAPAAADDLPIEDRYKDDGTITAADRERLSLRSGGAQPDMSPDRARAVPGQRVSEKDIVDELSAAGRKRFLMIGGGVALLVLLVILFLVLR